VIPVKEYWYELPPERIALYPLPERDQSKLLVYRDEAISHEAFKDISDYLPRESCLFFNDTRVIPARLLFQKSTGAWIELFLLSPVAPSSIVALAMEAKNSTQWICAIGNLKRWTDGVALENTLGEITLKARLVDRTKSLVEFSWAGSLSFAEVVSRMGNTPLPPYLNRRAEDSDRQRYQTVYSHHDGAVAAPTAGLHFTDPILHDLESKNHRIQFLTLHVSAGTFQPVKTENATDHVMHEEQIIITRQNIEALLTSKQIVAVGTTSLRTLESIYWYGVLLSENQEANFRIAQNDPYIRTSTISTQEAFTNVLEKMNSLGVDFLQGETSILILPGYTFRSIDALITNFHQPGSTLMLLIAALVGNGWRNIYAEALQNNYRFLSYGDSSLLFKKSK